MKRIFSILIIASLFLISSCVDKTPLSEKNKKYAGKWFTSDGTWIHIFNDGGGDFKKGGSSVSGGAATITDSTIVIGLFGIESTFSINETPYQEEGRFYMELDGSIYRKQDVFK